MDKSTIQLLSILSLITVLSAACAQDNNKKDRLTKVSGGRTKVVTQRDAVASAPASDIDQTSTPTATTPSAPTEKNVEQSEPIDEIIVTASSRCRATNSPQLDPSFRDQQLYCSGMEVKTDAEGKIDFAQLHSIVSEELPHEFKDHDIKTTDKKVRLKFASHKVKSKTEEQIKDILRLGFLIPHKIAELDAHKNIEVFINGVQLKNSDIVRLNPVDMQDNETGEVIVQITNAKLIENINFNLIISYSLK